MGIDPLIESTKAIERVLHSMEYGGYYLNQEPYGEPMMSKRDLYPTVNSPKTRSTADETDEESTAYDSGDRDHILDMMRILTYSDGTHPIVWIANRYDVTVEQLSSVIDQLCTDSLLSPIEYTPEYDGPFDPPNCTASSDTESRVK
jgi:aminopeptidase-like protein